MRLKLAAAFGCQLREAGGKLCRVPGTCAEARDWGKGALAMGPVEKIKEAVRKLSPEELAAFRAWFAEFDTASRDREFEEDVAAGRLDRLAEEALRDLREGRCTDL